MCSAVELVGLRVIGSRVGLRVIGSPISSSIVEWAEYGLNHNAD